MPVNSFPLYNFYTHVSTKPDRVKRFSCGESLLTIYSCGLKNKYEDLWSHHNYIVYVVKGRKIWHTSHGSYDLRQGSCVFIRKGAGIIEQFLDSDFCIFLFFLPDEFICDVLKRKSTPIPRVDKNHDLVFTLENNTPVQAFFQSMMTYFDSGIDPDQALLELKFRELILTIADNPANSEALSYFYSLLYEPHSVSLQRVMEENFCFNLKLEEFAKLSSRSLSVFKRDFIRLYDVSPGKWLLEKRLNHALHLLRNPGKSVSEAAFESGFESASHFSRTFRQRFGISPASMRQQAAALN